MPYIEPDLKRFEAKVRSQFGEDGVIREIARCLGIANGTYFEFGIGPAWPHPIESGLEGNLVLMAEHGWTGVFLDGHSYPPEYKVRQEFVTALNINQLYQKHGLPEDLDVMSIDVDGQEFWIWMALQYRPKVMIVEFNGSLGPDASITVPFDTSFTWDQSVYQGASLSALDKLAKGKFYTLVYSNGVNAIFIRDDLVSNTSDFKFEDIFVSYPPHAPDTLQRAWLTI